MGRAGGGKEIHAWQLPLKCKGDANVCRCLVVKNGCDLTLLGTWEFAVERRIDGEGMNFGQSVNEECNGKELFHPSPSPTWRVGLTSQDQRLDCGGGTGGSHRHVYRAEIH